jgi:hypothetical protein
VDQEEWAGGVPGYGHLVDRRNPRHMLAPTPDAATALLDACRRVGPGDGLDRARLRRPGVGHLVPRRPLPDLSEQARKDYALLQTPEFVEEFILGPDTRPGD